MKAIKAVDGKLEKLLDEIITGVDGGEKNLIEWINIVFDEIFQIENLANEVENEAENADKNRKSTESNEENIQEAIREIQQDLNRLENVTTYDGPEALQNAFDRSEKFDANSNELKDILGQVRAILKDYEEQLGNSKNFSSIALENFGKSSKDAETTVNIQQVTRDNLKKAGNLTEIEDEFENMKKIAKKAFDEANSTYNDAFELLNEVTALEINDKLNEFSKNIEALNKHSNETQVSLEDFAKENLKFLEDLDKTMDETESLAGKAFELQKRILKNIEIIKNIRADALKAIADKDSIVEIARNIYNGLDDFAFKVEKSREMARIAMEKIPEIVKKIQESVKIVEKLETKLDDQTKAAESAKAKCSTAKKQMDDILGESDEIREKIAKLVVDFEPLPDDARTSAKESMRLSDAFDNLEKLEAEDDKLIEATQVKIEKTKSQAQETDEKADEALEKLQALMDELSNLKNIDDESLNKFGESKIANHSRFFLTNISFAEAQLIEAEKELEESQLNHNLNILKAQRHDQTTLIDRYKLEIAELEYQVAVIKENAESLERKCFKRTRLEL